MVENDFFSVFLQQQKIIAFDSQQSIVTNAMANKKDMNE